MFSREVLERWDFYNAHKNDAAVLQPLRAKFRLIGIDTIPWHLVKKRTDALFLKQRGCA
jgi:hypothetical protein